MGRSSEVMLVLPNICLSVGISSAPRSLETLHEFRDLLRSQAFSCRAKSLHRQFVACFDMRATKAGYLKQTSEPASNMKAYVSEDIGGLRHYTMCILEGKRWKGTGPAKELVLVQGKR
jgi:hypothetical protein